MAQDDSAPTGDASGDPGFDLGRIVVLGDRQSEPLIGASGVGQAAITTFNRNTLDDAAALVAGVAASNSGGSRNERPLFVRGFNRFQVPLSIDGIRVYLPADNRLDYGRFLTADLAEIQVAKGYASVLDGPGAMGGAINLVTRKPSRTFEAEARGTLELDRDGDYRGYAASGLLGTRHDRWYAQASFARSYQDHWDLPGGFTPTASEDGGARDFSRSEDWRLNAKIGFTPNAQDEYSLSYTRQEGSKNAPLSTVDPVSSQRNWTWPWWNIDSIYFLSRTALTSELTLKTRLYRNGFNNLLRAYDDATQTTQTRGRSFDSYYEDTAWGGSAELALAFLYEDQPVSQSRNLGQGENYGIELSADARISPALSLGGNYTWTAQNLDDPSDSVFRPTGVPKHKAFVWAEWRPTTRLTLTPALDIASDRWTVTTDGTRYYRTGSYVDASLRADFTLTDGIELGAGVRNAFDDSYTLTDGFPEAGRRYFLSLSMKR